MAGSKLRLACPCLFGLESILNYEIKHIGGENITVTDGKVSFDGNVSVLARANLCLATAERVFIELTSFRAESFEALFQGVFAVPWENYIGITDVFPVKGHSLKSKLESIPACQSIIKKAVVERLKSKYNITYFEETGTLYQIQFALHRNIARIYLDTTGVGLHKRGYRRKSNAAPIKETLAAGIADLARIKPDSLVCDPMCGSGTLLIESAFKACHIAPGIRRKFAAQSWPLVPEEIWTEERNQALAEIEKHSSFRAIGSDLDPESVLLTNENAAKAGVASRISVSRSDVAKFTPPENAVTICNPPYGERMLETKQAEELYKKLGEQLHPSAANPCVIISPHEEFEKFFGRKADKRRKLYNGMIKCQLYMYFK